MARASQVFSAQVFIPRLFVTVLLRLWRTQRWRWQEGWRVAVLLCHLHWNNPTVPFVVLHGGSSQLQYKWDAGLFLLLENIPNLQPLSCPGTANNHRVSSSGQVPYSGSTCNQLRKITVLTDPISCPSFHHSWPPEAPLPLIINRSSNPNAPP